MRERERARERKILYTLKKSLGRAIKLGRENLRGGFRPTTCDVEHLNEGIRYTEVATIQRHCYYKTKFSANHNTDVIIQMKRIEYEVF